MSEEQLTAAMVADIFEVSRSAVSQTCKTYGIKADFERRVRKYVGEDLFFRTKQDQLAFIDSHVTHLLKQITKVVSERDAVIKAKGVSKGRPCETFDINTLIDSIHAIVIDLKGIKGLKDL